MNEKVIVVEQKKNVIVATPGPQGPRGRSILNGNGAPANNLGLEGDFYYDTATTRFYGPKPSDLTWEGAANYVLNTLDAVAYSWELSEVHGPDVHYPIYHIPIYHNLDFNPNVTVKTSSGDILETGIEYNSTKVLTLTMAQPFSGTAYLS